MSILSVRKLVKIYRGRKVVNSVEIEVKSGEVIGLLGPNGAGKTTTFYMIVGMIKPNGGKVFLNDDWESCLLINIERVNYSIYVSITVAM